MKICKATVMETSYHDLFMQFYDKSYRRCVPKGDENVFLKECNEMFISVIGGVLVNSITTETIQSAVDELIKRGYSLKSIEKHIELLRLTFTYYNHLFDKGFAYANYKKKTTKEYIIDFSEIKIRFRKYLYPNELETNSPEFLEYKLRRLSDVEMRAFMRACSRYKTGILFILIAKYGLSFEEAVALKWSDIDFDGHKIKVRGYISFDENKTVYNSYDSNSNNQLSKRRKIRPTSDITHKLKSNHNDSDYVFCDSNNSPLTEQIALEKLSRIINDINKKFKDTIRFPYYEFTSVDDISVLENTYYINRLRYEHRKANE